MDKEKPKETKPLTTYSLDLYQQLHRVWPSENFPIDNSHYTAKGIMVHITDNIDGQRYIMEIYPE